MAQIHVDFIYGKLSALTNPTDTSLQSPQFVALPVVSAPNTLTLILDPTASLGRPEIVYVTTHGSASNTVTVTRAQEGTTGGVVYPLNTDFVHNITANEIDGFGSGGGGGFIPNSRDIDITDATYGAVGGAVIGTPGAGANDGSALAQAIADAMDTSSFTKRKTIHIPGGVWKMRDASALPVLFLIDQATSAGDLIIQGDGRGRSTLYWPDALGLDTFGTPNYAINALNCSINSSLRLRGLSLQGSLPTATNAYNANATPISNAAGYGLRVPNRALYESNTVSGFYTGLVHDGTSPDGNSLQNTDHFKIIDMRINNCRDAVRTTNVNGRSRDQSINFNATGTRDFMYDKVDIGICQRAGYVASDTGAYVDTSWVDCHIANIPYEMLKEGTPGVTPTMKAFITFGHFFRTKFEGAGNFAIADQSRLAQIYDCRGSVGIHGIEINGQSTQAKLPNAGDHTVRNLLGTAFRTTDVTHVNISTAFNNPTPAGFTSPNGYDIAVGDHIAIAYTGSPATPTSQQLSLVDSAIVTAITDQHNFACTLMTTGLTDIDSGTPVGVSVGVIGSVQSGSFVSSPIDWNFLPDPTTKNLSTHLRFDLDGVSDNDWSSSEGPPPQISLRGFGTGGNSGSTIASSMNTTWRCGGRTMVLAQVGSGSFPYAAPLEQGANGARAIHTGDQIKPWGGFTRQPGNIVTTVTSNIVARPFVWTQMSGPFKANDSAQDINVSTGIACNVSAPHVGTRVAVSVAPTTTVGNPSATLGGSVLACSPVVDPCYTGELITGTGIPAGTFIQSISADGATLILSASPTAATGITVTLGQAGTTKQLQFKTTDTSNLFQRNLVVGTAYANAAGGTVGIEVVSPFFA